MSLRSATRLALRELRGGLGPFWVLLACLILGAAAMALRTPDRAQEAHTELYNTRHKPMPDAFASLPESYGDMPSRLGPPLPGDLGAAMIGAPRIEDAPENPFRYQPARVASAGSGTGAPSAADEARASDLFFINNSAGVYFRRTH